VGPTGGLDAMVKRKNLCPCREWNPGRRTLVLVTTLTELPRARLLVSLCPDG